MAIWEIYWNLKNFTQNYTKALTIYLNLFGETNSNVADAYYNLGILYGNLGNLLKSEEFYTKALTIFWIYLERIIRMLLLLTLF